MKKVFVLIMCVTACGAAFFAQEAPGTPASTMVDINVSFSTGYVLANFAETRIEDGRLRGAGVVKSTRGVSIDERQIFGGLDDNHTISTATELLAMASVLGIQDVKKEDALKLYVEIAMEGAANSFLGVTGTTHGQVLERLRGKYNFTQAEINGAIRQTVAAEVDREYNTRSFMLRAGNKGYTVLLVRNVNNNSYTLRYEGLGNDKGEFTSPNLNALLSELQKRGFTSGNCETVRRESGLFPAVQRISGVTDNDTIELIKYLLTDFYTANNQTAMLRSYKALLAIASRYNNLYETGGKSDVVLSAMTAMGNAIHDVLGTELNELFGKTLDNILAASQQQPQQVKTSLMSNDIETLADTVTVRVIGR